MGFFSKKITKNKSACGTMYHANGKVANYGGGTWYHANGRVATYGGGTWYHDNGRVATCNGKDCVDPFRFVGLPF